MHIVFIKNFFQFCSNFWVSSHDILLCILNFSMEKIFNKESMLIGKADILNMFTDILDTLRIRFVRVLHKKFRERTVFWIFWDIWNKKIKWEQFWKKLLHTSPKPRPPSKWISLSYTCPSPKTHFVIFKTL